MLLEEVLRGIDYRVQAGLPDINIIAINDDSRKVTPGSVFFAVTGYAKDGRDFVSEAVSKGAAVIVSGSGLRVPEGVVKVSVSDVRKSLASAAKNFYRDPSGKLKVIGITGTNGKTTITYLIEAIAKNAG